MYNLKVKSQLQRQQQQQHGDDDGNAVTIQSWFSSRNYFQFVAIDSPLAFRCRHNHHMHLISFILSFFIVFSYTYIELISLFLSLFLIIRILLIPWTKKQQRPQSNSTAALTIISRWRALKLASSRSHTLCIYIYVLFFSCPTIYL